MLLRNLNQLATGSKEQYSNAFVNKDIKIHKEFKERYEQVLSEKRASIQFFDYSAEITTSGQNKIFLPNQWFYIATFMADFYSELITYKKQLYNIIHSVFPDINNKKIVNIIKSLKEQNEDATNNKIKEAINEHFEGNADNISFMWKFVTDYEWWSGQKTIDRGDFYISPILKLLGLVNVSQSYVAEIVEVLASDSDLRREAEVLIHNLDTSGSAQEVSTNNQEILLPEQENELTSLNIAKNLILYGPPGTGKTFETVELALKICGYWTEDMLLDRRKAVNVFKKLQDVERIDFITFHQSMSYEEFIEGLSAQIHNDEVFYSVKDGIFKQICKRASRNIFNKGDIINKYEIVRIEKGLISVKNAAGAISPIPLDLVEDIAKNVLEGNCTLADVKRGENKERVSNLYDNYILGYKSILSSLVSHYIDNIEKVSHNKNYVLIIDEINRANISKVFGDLITLIEDDKRKGSLNEVKVRLPYSQEYFSVPNNLFIIGTMNTADRSIALMDIALRRRFEFKEIMPQAQILNSVAFDNDEIDLSELLEVINKRITILLDRNYSIGQALFMNIEDIKQLVSAIKNKLLPLLQEYFYEDWEKISLVLGDNQKIDSSNKIIIKDFDYDLSNLFGNTDYINEDEAVYTINSQFGLNDEQDFHIIKSIYEKKS
ncbi:hypothetical protein C1N83_28010 (plasmid) [Priestia aryabhattai]